MILFIFVDGMGIRSKKENNPFFAENLPVLRKLLFEEAEPVDPVMGIKGVPQSATGQTSIFTGLNASAINGSHKEGFPNKLLKKLLKEKSIFRYLRDNDKKFTFANGYIIDNLKILKKSRFLSATSYMTIEIGKKVRGLDKIIKGKAVYHDITNLSLIDRKDNKFLKKIEKFIPEYEAYYNKDLLEKIPLIKPSDGAHNLLEISRKNDFTLFEYFKTDMIGHKKDEDKALEVLSDLEEFFKTLLDNFHFNKDTLILVSDHGNIEDLSIPGHTKNPVPLFISGYKEEMFQNISYIYDLAHKIKEYY